MNIFWCPQRESNTRPLPYHGIALPPELYGPLFKFDYKNEQAITTFMTKKMLDYNFLASTYPAATASYNDKILNKYARALNNVFFELSKYVNFNKKIPLKKKEIKGSKFGRLTG